MRTIGYVIILSMLVFTGCSSKKHELKQQKKKSEKIVRNDTRNVVHNKKNKETR